MESIKQYSAQVRLGRIYDNYKRQAFTHQLKFTSIPTEVLRIHCKRTKEGDAISRVVSKAEICHITFPVLEKVPIRQVDSQNGTYQITSLVNAFSEEEDQHYLLRSSEDLNIGDIVVRCMFGDKNDDRLTVLLLEIADIFGTFGTSSLIYKEYQATLLAEELPQKLLQLIYTFARRRKRLNF